MEAAVPKVIAGCAVICVPLIVTVIVTVPAAVDLMVAVVWPVAAALAGCGHRDPGARTRG